MKPIRLLLADDHHLFRKGLASLLEKEPAFEIAGEAQDGAEAIAMARALRPDLVLMDIHMPVVNGLEATRQIAEGFAGHAHRHAHGIRRRQGSFRSDQVWCPWLSIQKIEPERLRELLIGVFRGEAPLSRSSAAKILREFAASASSGFKKSSDDELTPREKDVLQLIAGGLTNKEIGGKLDIAENTVKNHLKSILAKLHLQNRVQAATLAIQQGLHVSKPSGE